MAETATSNPNSQQRDRQEQILDIAASLIQTRGFSGFSYQDIADALAIRKASIHYYFPSKAGLGLAAMDRYAARIDAALAELEADGTLSARAVIERYCEALVEIARTSDNFCLAGALAAELMVLPDDIRKSVDAFFQRQQAWLARIIERGFANGEIQSSLSPEQLARLVFSAAEGALLIKRTSGDLRQMLDVVYALKQHLFGDEGE
jgi:TetR/AcrR family transcriptional repressor of nem operon